MSASILVLSPHLDDAALSCADHISSWKEKNHDITVMTLFTRFSNTFISEKAKEYLQKSGFSDAKAFEEARKKEDRTAMEGMGIRYIHCHFTDGWFRSILQKPIYSDEALFTGTISPLDKTLIGAIKKKLSNIGKYDKIIAPYGIGGHADHLITKRLVREIFPKDRIYWYCDYPYALDKCNWSVQQFFRIVPHIYSVKIMSFWKKNLLSCYTSQIPLLFSSIPQYWEILLHNKF